MSEEFCEYLRTYRWKGDMYALPEGTVCYPHVQMVRIECDLVGAILIETYLLQTMNFHSLIATKATRVTGLNTHTPAASWSSAPAAHRARAPVTMALTPQCWVAASVRPTVWQR